jgi:hypothetical protein
VRRGLLLGVAGLALAASCGKRGDPLPPLRRTPQAVTGLRVVQRGDRIEVSYAAPRTATDEARLPVLEVEIFHAEAEGDIVKVGRRVARKAAPGESLVESLPLPAPGTRVRVAARAVAWGRPSALTPEAALTVKPPPPRPAGLEGRLVPAGVALSWIAVALPAPSPSPTPLPDETPLPAASPSPSPPPKSGYWVYRRPSGGAYTRPLTAHPVAGPPATDEGAAPGESVCYVVRAVAATDPVVESAPSEEVCLTVRDVAPPAPPSGVAAIAADGAIEVSWSPSPEPDLAGYRIYRATPGGEPVRLAEVGPGETSYRDASEAGAPYLYTLTAVDAAGNESAPSAAAEVIRP